MNSEVKELWTKALRSGDYKQTMGTLHRTATDVDLRPSGFCCLGVLCDVAVKQGVIPEPTFDEDDGTHDFGDMDFNYPPEAVLEWAGLGTDVMDPVVPREAVGIDVEIIDIPSIGLSDLNDAYGFNFNQIADVIEQNL